MPDDPGNKPIAQLTLNDLKKIAEETRYKILSEIAKPAIYCITFIIVAAIMALAYVATNSKKSEIKVPIPGFDGIKIETHNSLLMQIKDDVDSIRRQIAAPKHDGRSVPAMEARKREDRGKAEEKAKE